MQEHTFEFVSNGLPYVVKVIPYKFNDETRFRVSYNGGGENIFAWDTDVKRLRAIGDDSSTFPDDLGIIISKKLESKNY